MKQARFSTRAQLTVELHAPAGPDFRTVGSAGLPLSLLLGDSSGPAGRKVPREVQLRNESGEAVGTLRYSVAMRRSIAKQLQVTKRKNGKKKTIKKGKTR